MHNRLRLDGSARDAKSATCENCGTIFYKINMEIIDQLDKTIIALTEANVERRKQLDESNALNQELKTELNHALVELHQARAEVERVKQCCEQGDKMLQQVKHDRDEARDEVERLKLQNDQLRQGWSNTIMDGDDIPPLARPEPSRLEIAAQIYAAFAWSQCSKDKVNPSVYVAMKCADELIAAAKEGK